MNGDEDTAMGRPRSVSDEQILQATMRVVAREGPLRFTLAQVGEEAGLSAPALVQRFGGKRQLLLALSARSRREPGDTLRAARAAHPSALDALVEGLAGAMAPLRTPKEVARSLEYLALDMADPEFHEHALVFFDAMRAEVAALLQEARTQGELARQADVVALARACEVAFNGSVITWGVRQDGDLADALRRDIAAVLAPSRTLRTSRRTGRAARSPPARRPASGGGRASRGR